jgi:hypothetical protein
MEAPREVCRACLERPRALHRAAHDEQAWLTTSYDDARHALQNPRLVTGEMTMAYGGRGLLPPEVFARSPHRAARAPPLKLS